MLPGYNWRLQDVGGMFSQQEEMKKIKESVTFSRKTGLLIVYNWTKTNRYSNTGGKVTAVCVLYTRGQVELRLVPLSHAPGSLLFHRPLLLEWERNGHSSILRSFSDHRQNLPVP